MGPGCSFWAITSPRGSSATLPGSPGSGSATTWAPWLAQGGCGEPKGGLNRGVSFNWSRCLVVWGLRNPQVACYAPSVSRFTQVCWPGPEPQGTPNHTFLSPNGSPSNRFGHFWRRNSQNSGPDLAVGVPGPESQLFFDPFWSQQMHKCVFLAGFRIYVAPIASDLGPHGPPWAPFLDFPSSAEAEAMYVNSKSDFGIFEDFEVQK